MRLSVAAEAIALAELLADYFARTDRIVDAPGEALFAVDGRMRLGALVRDGRGEIAKYFAARRAEEDRSGRKVRHVMANMVVTDADSDRARIRFQCLVFAGIGNFPLPSAAPATIADFDVDCVRADESWLIAELRGTTTFIGANAASFSRKEPTP